MTFWLNHTVASWTAADARLFKALDNAERAMSELYNEARRQWPRAASDRVRGLSAIVSASGKMVSRLQGLKERLR